MLTVIYILLGSTSAIWKNPTFSFSSSSRARIICSVAPPVSIYSCLLEEAPKEVIGWRNNDALLQWVGHCDATFAMSFAVTSSSKWSVLELRDVDTVAEVVVNDKTVGELGNMFRTYRFDITSFLGSSPNMMEIRLKSPVQAAAQAARESKQKQYPECTVSAQTNGQCHINMLRKAQYSFSWDWGPSMPDSGIYSIPVLYQFDYTKMVEARLQLMSRFKVTPIVKVDILVLAIENVPTGMLNIKFDSDVMAKPRDHLKFVIGRKVGNLREWHGTMEFEVSSDISWWWPNGFGKQPLYMVTVNWIDESGDQSSIEKEFGFRTISLVEDSLHSGGTTFYFKVNDMPVFMTGSNWIPSSSAVPFYDEFYENNLRSARDAGIRMLRVWGGGIYENEKFYRIANKYGILIWQDFMFACSTYSDDTEFLESVSEEVMSQIWRLSSNPSVALWAGNNENEAALSGKWWSIPEAKTFFYFDQYRALYIDTIRRDVLSANLSVPFISSSPTNGIESEKESWIAENPYDTDFGDVHFYDYSSNCLEWGTFPPTRFASEFGYQSWALVSSVENITAQSDRLINSKWFEQRNHHQDGNQQIANMIQTIFGEQSWINEENEKAFGDFVYLSQVVQSLCTTSEAAYYRSRAGTQGTMGALYWQLNDVWTTASWSSLDYSQNWKPLHFEIKKVFRQPMTLISTVDENDFLQVFGISDASDQEGTLIVSVFTWDSFDETGTKRFENLKIPAGKGTNILSSNVGFLLPQLGCPYGLWNKCFFKLSFVSTTSEEVEAWQVPVPFSEIDDWRNEDASLEASSCSIDGDELSITINSDRPQPFVWLETKFRGRWTNNNLLILHETTTVKFKPFNPVVCNHFLADLRIFYPSKILNNVPSESSNSSVFILISFFLVIIITVTACVFSFTPTIPLYQKPYQATLDFKKKPPRVLNKKTYYQL